MRRAAWVKALRVANDDSSGARLFRAAPGWPPVLLAPGGRLGVERRHFGRGEGEVEDVEVLREVRRLRGLDHEARGPLDDVAEADLGGGDVAARGGDVDDVLVPDDGAGRERRIGLDGDAPGRVEAQERFGVRAGADVVPTVGRGGRGL